MKFLKILRNFFNSDNTALCCWPSPFTPTIIRLCIRIRCSNALLPEKYKVRQHNFLPSLDALDLHKWLTTLEIKIRSFKNGQKGRTVAFQLAQTVKRP